MELCLSGGVLGIVGFGLIFDGFVGFFIFIGEGFHFSAFVLLFVDICFPVGEGSIKRLIKFGGIEYEIV